MAIVVKNHHPGGDDLSSLSLLSREIGWGAAPRYACIVSAVADSRPQTSA